MVTNVNNSSFSIEKIINGFSEKLEKVNEQTKQYQDDVLAKVKIIQTIPDHHYMLLIKAFNDDSIDGLELDILRSSKKLQNIKIESILGSIDKKEYAKFFHIAKKNSGDSIYTNKFFDIIESQNNKKQRLYLYLSYNKEFDVYHFYLLRLRDYKTEIIHTLDVILGMVDSRNPETGEHLKRLSDMSVFLAKKLKETGNFDQINSEFIANIGLTAPIHDIGKISISDDILLKPGKLTEEEFKTMTFHCSNGANIIKKLEKTHGNRSLLEMAKNITLCHHEKWDGSGYPENLDGENIPLEGRIVAITDVLDALKTKRPYKEAFSDEKTYKIIKEGRGKHFDPRIVDILFENWDKVLGIRKQNEDIIIK